MMQGYQTRELGSPSGVGMMWGAIGGLVGALVIGIPLHAMGVMQDVQAALLREDNVWLGWGLHLVAGMLAGLLYGALVTTGSFVRGTLYGAVFGLVVGIVLVLVLANLLVGNPVPLDASGMGIALLHALWGAIVGATQAWGVRNASRAWPPHRRLAGRAH